MTIRAILFDWGGTLVEDDTLQPGAAAAAVCAALAEAGHELSPADFEAAFAKALPPYVPGQTTTSPRIDHLLEATLDALGLPANGTLVETAAHSFCAADYAAQRVYPDARAALASLCWRGYPVAVVSNTIFPARYFAPRIAAAGLQGYLQAVICSADVGFGKPHPAPYEAALAALGAEPGEALFIGDRLDTDIAGADAIGIPWLHLDRRSDAATLPARTIRGLGELSTYLGEGIRPET